MSLKYRPEIDGLRAVAVIPVILFHAGFSAFGGGFVGVDIFFVISGYLITSLIISDVQAGTFSFIEFYERRARRILPALLFVLFCCLPFAYLWLIPVELKEFSRVLVSVILFISNIRLWEQSSYFEKAAEFKPLLHTWSLAVEEQFYIIFPILILILWRIRRVKLIYFLLGLWFASFAFSQYAASHHPSFNFYWLPTRAWELLAGALCSFLKAPLNRQRDNLISIAGFAAILVSIFLYDKTTPFPSFYALLPVLGACGLLVTGTGGTIVGRFLSNQIFVGIGLVSYSAYLWHQPLFAFARTYSSVELSLSVLIFLVMLTFGLAYLSWRFVERPFRDRTSSFGKGRRVLFGALGSTAAVLATVGIAGQEYRGFPNRFVPLPIVSLGLFTFPSFENGYCFYSVNDSVKLELGDGGVNCSLGSISSTSRVLLFGDSLAAQWEPFWDTLGKNIGFQINVVTTNWCFPALTHNFITDVGTHQRAFNQCIYNRDFLRSHANEYDVIILGGHWAKIHAMNFSQDVLQSIQFILKNSKAKILVMPSSRFLLRSSVEKSVNFGRIQLVSDAERQTNADAMMSVMANLTKTNDRITLISSASLFGNYYGSEGVLTSDGFPYSLDGTHMSVYGALSAARNVLADEVTLNKFKNYFIVP